MKYLIIAAALATASCASVAAVNPDGGVVEGAMSAKDALGKADVFCEKTGRTAKAVRYEGLTGSLTFECVARAPTAG